MNGVEFVRALRAEPETRAVPVIMLTSRSSDKHRTLALDAGVDVFLTKPYTEDVLASHITRQLAARVAAAGESAVDAAAGDAAAGDAAAGDAAAVSAAAAGSANPASGDSAASAPAPASRDSASRDRASTDAASGGVDPPVDG